MLFPNHAYSKKTGWEKNENQNKEIWHNLRDGWSYLWNPGWEGHLLLFNLVFTILTAHALKIWSRDNKVRIHFCKPVPPATMHHIIIIGLVPWGHGLKLPFDKFGKMTKKKFISDPAFIAAGLLLDENSLKSFWQTLTAMGSSRISSTYWSKPVRSHGLYWSHFSPQWLFKCSKICVFA